MSNRNRSSKCGNARRVAILLSVSILCWISSAAAQTPQPGYAYRIALKDDPRQYLTVGADGGIVRWEENNADKRQYFVFDRDGGKYRIKTIQTSRFENRYLAIQGDGHLRAERLEANAPRQQFAFKQYSPYFALVESTKGEFVDVNPTTGFVLRWSGEGGHPKSNQLFKLVDEVRISQVSDPPWDWMNSLSDSLPLSRLSIPGTHDSGAKNGTEFVRCQNGSILDQLAMGVRFLDIRVRAVKRNGGALDIYHGPVDLGLKFETVLDEVKGFLRYHPRESVLMRMANETAKEEGAPDAPTILKRIVDANKSLFYTEGRVPTLGEARGRIVLISDGGSRSVGSTGLYNGNNSNISIEGNAPGGGDSWVVYGAGATGIPAFLDFKWNRIKESNSQELDKLRFTYISGTGLGQGGLFPSTVAVHMNPAIFERMQRPGYAGKFRYGVIVMDFSPSGIVDHLIRSNLQP